MKQNSMETSSDVLAADEWDENKDTSYKIPEIKDGWRANLSLHCVDHGKDYLKSRL